MTPPASTPLWTVIQSRQIRGLRDQRTATKWEIMNSEREHIQLCGEMREVRRGTYAMGILIPAVAVIGVIDWIPTGDGGDRG